MKRLALVAVCFFIVIAMVAGQTRESGNGAESTNKKWPPQFPRPGATKIFENDDVMVWDDVLMTYDNHYHKHIRDIVTIFIQPGPFTITNEGRPMQTFNYGFGARPEHPALGLTLYNPAPIGPHSEAVLDLALPRRTIMIELKKTLLPDAPQWSTDPTGKIATAFPLYETPQPVMVPTVNKTAKKWPSLGEALDASGAIKTHDNKHVTVWDETLLTTQQSLRKNVRDVIAVQIVDGVTKFVNGENGKEVEVGLGIDQKPPRKMPSVYFLKAGTGPWSDAATNPQRPRRTIWVELKGTEAPDCRTWSTDPACK